MLTSIYYYGLYKPYIVANRETSVYAPKRSRIADRREAVTPEKGGQVYILNKSLKDEIVRYAQGISYSATNLRASTRQTSADMENFNRNIHREGFEKAQTWLEDDLSEFADNYNTAAEFMQGQQHSTDLRTFSYELADNVFYNRERLDKLGLALSESGRLHFDREAYRNLSQDQVNIAIGENIEIFSDLHRQTGDLLREPLAEHMNFKGLSYHYNYKMGAMVADDGFSIIETGLLIDKAV